MKAICAAHAIGRDAEAAGDAAEAAVAAEIEDDDDATWQQVLQEAHWAQMREDKAYGAVEILADDADLASLCSSSSCFESADEAMREDKAKAKAIRDT